MGRTDRASLLLHADAERIFAALTEQDALERWLSPSGMSGRFERFDMRPGGSYRMVLTYLDASDAPGTSTADTDVAEARIVELDAPRLVVHEVEFDSPGPAFAGTMRMSFRVVPEEDGATVVVEATDVPPGVGAADHAEGIAGSLVNLARHLERLSPSR
jgi:uncharacterized protein YndB with AHSA1/START domain